MTRSRKTYSGAFKAKVVIESIQGRVSLKELADLYELHPNQIKNWKSQLFRAAPKVLDDKRKNRSIAL